MNYAKIKDNGQIMTMPNPITLKFSNPTEEKKVLIAKLDSWLVVKNTEPPTYDPETEYLESHYEQTGEVEPQTNIPYAVQIWEVKPIPEPPVAEENESN